MARFLAGVFALLLAVPSAAQTIDAVEAVGITVADLDRSVAFYQEVLDFEPVAETALSGDTHERLMGVFGARVRIAHLQLGDERVDLVDYLAPEGRPYPEDMRSNDQAFQHIAIIVSDMDAAYDRLVGHGVQFASAGPQTLPDWNPNAGGIRAFYFRDPDGNHLELLEFPPDKGDPRWHVDDGRLFLGIDHTAIVVDDTDRSIAFYEALGFRVAGASENYGIEQERLNNVFGARLRITALKALEGPAIELLEYLAPSTGRPTPVDTLANDLWHWHIQMRTGAVDAAVDRVRDAGGHWVSPGVVFLVPDVLDASTGALVRDPDHHGLLVLGGPVQ